MVTGLLNKQIAAELGVTEETVKVHRARVMQKMEVVSLAELVRLAERVDGISVESNLITGEVVKRVASLTPREYQVFALVVTGLLNKQIAAELGVALGTVKSDRARVMQKMEVVSLVELVRLAERVGVLSVEGNLITGEIVKQVSYRQNGKPDHQGSGRHLRAPTIWP